MDRKGTDRKAKGPVRAQEEVPRGKHTLLRRMLILLPLALHLSDTMPPAPGTSSARFLQLQCTFASLQGGGQGSQRKPKDPCARPVTEPVTEYGPASPSDPKPLFTEL